MTHTTVSPAPSYPSAQRRHQMFLPLLMVCGVIWYTYRLLFEFPVFFDESIGKLIFFGLPVWLYIVIAQTKVIRETLTPDKLLPGLYLGIAFGGLYGLVGSLTVYTGYSDFQPLMAFMSSRFWWEFFLALLTGFWETLFFYSWVFLIAEKRFPSWNLAKVVLFTTFVFVMFHIPNTLLRFPLDAVMPQLILLAFFALGQALIFSRYRNLYALALSHAIWGMVLLFYS